MGFSISWLAVKGKERELVLRELALTPTGERDELPAESPIAAASLEDDWHAIVFNRFDHELLRDEVLKRVSEGCELVAAGAEEHVMCSFASGWRDGERVWWSTHDSQNGLYDLQAEGSLPEGFEALRAERLDEQRAAERDAENVDYVFEIPLETAKRVTGFSYDEAEPEEGFAVLRVAVSPND